ncbi:MAG: hypothetical protein R3C10_04035 [Pirellulales bacterium]
MPAIESGQLAELVADWFGLSVEELERELARPRSKLRRALARAEGLIEQRLLRLIVAAVAQDKTTAREWIHRNDPPAAKPSRPAKGPDPLSPFHDLRLLDTA